MAEDERSNPASASETGVVKIGNQLFSKLYEELHRVAVRELRRNSAAVLSPTTLLHETFLNVSQRELVEFTNRPQFMSYAARAMRGLIIDHMRRSYRQKRGRQFEVVPLSEGLQIDWMNDKETEQLRDALDALAELDPRLAECVDLKFFCGFSFRDIAQLWNVSERTVLRDWDKARILLSRMINSSASDLQKPS